MEDEGIVVAVAAAVKAQQAIRAAVLAFDDDNQDQKRTRRHFPRTDYNNSTWGRMLRDKQCHDPTHPDGAQFRRRFAIPYSMFIEIYEEAKSWTTILPDGKVWKAEKDAMDAYGQSSAPLHLKILGVFRVISKGYHFDGIAELCVLLC